MPPTRQPDRALFHVLLGYTNQRSLLRGKALHAHLLRTSTATCVHLSNGLVNFYAKCGHLRSARHVFDFIPKRDAVSWNCIINAYARHPGGPASVWELFSRMRQENTLPNPHTFSGVFTALASGSGLDSSSDAWVCRQVHVLAVKTESLGDVFVGSSLVNVYCKLGLLVDAGKVFDRMLERNSVSWTAMISGYASRRVVGETLGLFETMRLEAGKDEVNEFVYTSVLSALGSAEFVGIGKGVHSLLVKNGLLSFVSVVNALVTMYAKCGSLDDSLTMFELSGEKNAITWSAMITGFAQSGDSLKALELFSKMHYGGIVPSEFTLVGFLNACSDAGAAHEGKQGHAYLVKLGYESQIYIMTALVDMYAKCGCTVDARKGFDNLLEPDIVLWTSMIAGYVQNGQNEDALVLFGRMRMEGILPNELTMASVLKACSSLAALDQGKQFHANGIKCGFGLQPLIGSALSTMYAKCGNLDDADRAFRRMSHRDVISWNAMISGLSQNGHGKEALDLFEEMRNKGTEPDCVTFVNVLSACSHMGLVDRAWGYFEMMNDEFGVVPRVEHYACIVDVLSRAGKLNEAKEFIESATIDHGLCLWRILLSASRSYRNYELGAYAGEKLMELGSQESSAYVMLSSIYTALGQPESVERVRSVMRGRGVRKEPGCSWIEVQSHIHTFVVGDELHPQNIEIRDHIQTLGKQMKDEFSHPSMIRSLVMNA